MTAQVLFLNTAYVPEDEKKKYLEFVQGELELYQVELRFQSREWTRFQQVVFREQSHNNVRRSWRLIRSEDYHQGIDESVEE